MKIQNTSKAIFFTAVIACIPSIVFTQDLSIHEKNFYPTDAQYQIVESPNFVSDTFLLDTFNGEVYQLTLNEKDEQFWRKMHVDPNPFDTGLKNSQPNYYIHISANRRRSIFLVNFRSGATWSYARDIDTELHFWSRME